MANERGVWGIDIGQCALKAMRCVVDDSGKGLVAKAFDYIEYPKILSQPDAEPELLIREAVTQFLSRNSLRGDKVALSVSGQSGLARFIKLPPVEAKKIPDIVKYEARQQIPFALEEVVWDYQQMPGASEEDGFALETEVGLFAMKRDQVFRAIKPLVDAEVELDVIQLTPICIYNAMAFDLLSQVEAGRDYDPDQPPESIVILAMGTETSDLVITNGYRVWQRSIPLGGSHFTKALTKELKLTFAKAEHLKRHANEAEDPKALFQAMRSVFGDLVTEIQRSLGYFQNIDRTARVGRLVMLGNAAKLPGLKQYLTSRLERDVVVLDAYHRLSGAPVLSTPAFADNYLSFAVCYGLTLQGLGKGKLSTNLVPRELITQRMIRMKKPWVAAIAGVLMLGLASHFFFRWDAWHAVHPATEVRGTSWTNIFSQVDKLQQVSQGHVSTDTQQATQLAQLNELGEGAVGTVDGRLLWLELFRAINHSLPVDEKEKNASAPLLNQTDWPLQQRKRLYIHHVESEYFADLATWFTPAVKTKYVEGLRTQVPKPADAAVVDPVTGAPLATEGAPAPAGVATAPPDALTPAESAAASPAADPTLPPGNGTMTGGAQGPDVAGPKGPGWVIEIGGYHFYNSAEDMSNWGAQFVRNTLLKELENGEVELPVHDPQTGETRMESFKYKELGIEYPTIVMQEGPKTAYNVPNPDYQPPKDEGLTGTGVDTKDSASEDAKRYLQGVKVYQFWVQFSWTQIPVTQRLKNRISPPAAVGAVGDTTGGTMP